MAPALAWSAERVEPDPVVVHERVGVIDLFLRHLLPDLFKADRGIGIAADRAQDVPHVGPHEIGRGEAGPNLVVPANAGLGTGVTLHRRAQVPFERPDLVLLDAEAQGIHDADQLLGLGVARPRGGPKRCTRLLEAAGFHQVTRLFKLGRRRNAEPEPDQRRNHAGPASTSCKHASRIHAVFLAFISCVAPLAGADAATDLPAPLSEGDFIAFDSEQAALGRLLFYDKILSGNQNISCGTCHHHDHASSDGLSLGIGEGGDGLGPLRTAGEGRDRIRRRIARNSLGLWNLGHKDIALLLHDGRLSPSPLYGNGFNSPAEEWLPKGLASLLAAQALLPLASAAEMAGDPGENEVAGAIIDRIDKGWPILAKRVRTIPEYGELFVAAFDHVERPEDVSIVEIANAIAAFIGTEFRNHDSPFDRHLAGDATALKPAERRGMELFFGEAGCSGCHSGPLLSDQSFHALGLPAFGPGRKRIWDPMPRDVGRMGESDELRDAYRFRTPFLRNVALTAPYGHNGAMPTLEDVVRHHLDPAASRARWTPAMAALPPAPWLADIDFVIQSDVLEMARQERAMDISLPPLSNEDVEELVAFLNALTGETADQRPLGRPERVPSGLPVD